MIARVLAYLVVLMGAVYSVYRGWISPSFSIWSDYLAVLLTMSGMIFTVMGLWIAIIYPDALKKIDQSSPQKSPKSDQKRKREEISKDTQRLESLVVVVLLSALVVVGVFLLHLSRAIFIGSQFYAYYKDFFITSGVGVAIILGAIQIESVVKMIGSNIHFLLTLHDKKEDRDADDDV